MIFCGFLRNMDLSKSAPPERARQRTLKYSQMDAAYRLTKCRSSALRQLKKSLIFAEELEIRFDEGDNKFVLCNALPLFDVMGAVRGAVGAFADVTNLKRTEAALRASETRLQFALEAAGAGTWEVTLETGELRASNKMLYFLGLWPQTRQ